MRQRFSAGVGLTGDPGSTYESIVFARSALRQEFSALLRKFPDQDRSIADAIFRYETATAEHPDETSYADHFTVRGFRYVAFIKPE